jgi:hypothetical protein
MSPLSRSLGASAEIGIFPSISPVGQRGWDFTSTKQLELVFCALLADGLQEMRFERLGMPFLGF